MRLIQALEQLMPSRRWLRAAVRTLAQPASGIALVVLAAIAFIRPAAATPVTITTNTTLLGTDTTIGTPPMPLAEADITVQNGATLTVNGEVTIRSLKVTGGGVVTHQADYLYDADPGVTVRMVGGCHIHTIMGVEVTPTGFINVSERGFAGSEGPGAGQDSLAGQCAGGGGYGGSGGYGTYGPGHAYGSFSQPVDLGSGGGSAGGVTGLRGGGAVRLSVGGSLLLNGSITANGQSGGGSTYGAGAGGSVWIAASAISGQGLIQANGGGTSDNWCPGSKGGGGRVAVYGDLSAYNSSTSAVQARGGSNSGAGTIYRAATGQRAQLIFDNGGVYGQSALNEPLVVGDGINVIIRGNAALSHDYGDTHGLTVQITNDLTIEPTGFIDVGARGYAGGQGPGAGQDTPQGQCAAGGGYGGSGGNGGALGGHTYGSYAQPTHLGSGGGNAGSVTGLRGGGAVRLIVLGTLNLNGSIAADGQAGGGSTYGAGAGGSIWVTAGTLIGQGFIHANGGGTSDNWCPGSKGGAGRVAIYGDASGFNTSSNAIQAHGGGADSGAGTIFRSQSGQFSQLVFDNGGVYGQSVQGESLIVPSGTNVFIRNGAALTHEYGDNNGLMVEIHDSLTIEANGLIDVSRRGYGGGQGPGTGQSALAGQCAGGGGYGGVGGSSSSMGGRPYGSITYPTQLGSGGGNSGSVSGLRGGGALRLNVGGTLTVDANGYVAANGQSGGGSTYGAGSGGSLLIFAGAIVGGGNIQANGGGTSDNWCPASKGGGGRVAIYACSVAIPPARITASPGGAAAQAGSVFYDPTATAVVVIKTSPGSACAGSSFNLSAQTIGGSNFQWRRDGVPITNGPGRGGTVYSGANTATLTITSLSPIDGAAAYTISLTNPCGDVVSAPVLRMICPADFNCSGGVTVQDIFDFLSPWFTNNPTADFNGVGGVTVQDLFDFLIAYFAGCP